jgi:hypothetical protein
VQRMIPEKSDFFRGRVSSFGLGAACSLVGGEVLPPSDRSRMITPREEPSLSASERLAAIAELFARGVQRLLATRQRDHRTADDKSTLRSATHVRSDR